MLLACGPDGGCSDPENSVTEIDAGNSKTIFRKIKSGSFQMGSDFYKEVSEEERKYFIDESPIHQVTITRDLWVSESEISVGQFSSFVSETNYMTDAEKAGESLGKYVIVTDPAGKKSGSWEMGAGLNWKNPGFPVSDSQPVVHISWNDANEYCKWLSKKTGKGIRLLTEAEWEYCAGGDRQSVYSWGNGLPTQENGGNIADISFKNTFPDWRYPVMEDYNDGYIYPSPVKSFPDNHNGLYDMTGNVWEWTSDFYQPDYYSKSETEDPSGPNTGEEHTIRGGGFDWELSYLRIAKRRRLPPGRTACNLGFRVCFNP